MILPSTDSANSNGKPRTKAAPLLYRWGTLGRHLLVVAGTTASEAADRFAETVFKRLALESLPNVGIAVIDTAELTAEYLSEASRLRILPAGNDELENCREFSDTVRHHIPNDLAESASLEGCGADPRAGWATGLVRWPQIEAQVRRQIAKVAADDVGDKLREGQFEGMAVEPQVLHVDLLFGIAGASGGPLGLLLIATIRRLAAEFGLRAVVRVSIITSSAYQRGNKANQLTRDRNTASILALLQEYRNGQKITLHLPDTGKITTVLKVETVSLVGGVLPLEEQLQLWADSHYYFTTSRLGQTERARAADPKKNVSDSLDPLKHRCNLSTMTGKTVFAIPEDSADRLPNVLISRALDAELAPPADAAMKKALARVQSDLAASRIGAAELCREVPRPSVGTFLPAVDDGGVEARRASRRRAADVEPAVAALTGRVKHFGDTLGTVLGGCTVTSSAALVAHLAAQASKEARGYAAAEAERTKAASTARHACKAVLAAPARDRKRADQIEAALQAELEADLEADALRRAAPVVQELSDHLRALAEQYERQVEKLKQAGRESSARVLESSPTCRHSSLLSAHELAALVPLDPLRRLCRIGTRLDKPALVASLRDKARELTEQAVKHYGKSFLAAWNATPRQSLVSYVQTMLDRLPPGIVLKDGARAALPLWNIDLVGLPADLYLQSMRGPHEKHDIFFEPIRENDRIVFKRATHGISIAWLEDTDRYEEALRERCLADPQAALFTLTADMPVPLLKRPYGTERAELEALALLLTVPDSPLCVTRDEVLVYCGDERVEVAQPDEEWTEAWSRAIREGRLPDVDTLMEHYVRLVVHLPRETELAQVREYVQTNLIDQKGKALWTQLRLTAAMLAWLEETTTRRGQSGLARPERSW